MLLDDALAGLELVSSFAGPIIDVGSGGGTPVATPFLDLSSLVTTSYERGLLSMAFAPDYATSGKFYVYFNVP